MGSDGERSICRFSSSNSETPVGCVSSLPTHIPCTSWHSIRTTHGRQRNLSYRHAHAQPNRQQQPNVTAHQPSTHKPSSASPIASLSQRRRSTASRQKQQHACKGRSGSPRGQPSSHSGVAHHTRVRRSTSHAQARAGTYCHVRHEGLCSAARGRQRLSGLLSHGSSRARAHAQAQHHHHWSIRIGPSGELHFTHTNAHTSQQKHSQYLTTMTIPNLTTRHASTPSSAEKPVTNTKPTTSTSTALQGPARGASISALNDQQLHTQWYRSNAYFPSFRHPRRRAQHVLRVKGFGLIVERSSITLAVELRYR